MRVRSYHLATDRYAAAGARLNSLTVNNDALLDGVATVLQTALHLGERLSTNPSNLSITDFSGYDHFQQCVCFGHIAVSCCIVP